MGSSASKPERGHAGSALSADASLDTAFTAALDTLCETLGTREPRIAVGFSGGLDSTMLLQTCVRRLGAGRVLAAHVDHRLQAQSSDWATHCHARAHELGVTFARRTLAPPDRFPDGVEAWARHERRAALAEMARDWSADAIALAHHADDQIETVLLNIGRGAGLRGAAGMPALVRRQGQWWWRPWLGLTRAALSAAGRAGPCVWLDDPSNGDDRWRRNALRHSVLPLLEQHLPGFGANLLRHAALSREAGELLERSLGTVPTSPVVDRRPWLVLDAAEQAWHLRRWLFACGLRAPSVAALAEMRAQLLLAESATARIEHDGMILRRYRDRIELIAAGDTAPAPPDSLSWRWRGEPRLELPGYGGALVIEPSRSGIGIARERLLGEPLTIRPAGGSARMRLIAGGPNRRLKTLCQERGIPVWQRRRLPMVLDRDGRAVFVAQIGVNADWVTARPAETPLELRFEAL
ncbi:MAG: tRNA lysidine(34) synthetase TilS [Burkholderiaceae bacterium]